MFLIKRNLRFGFDNLKLRNFHPRQSQSNGMRVVCLYVVPYHKRQGYMTYQRGFFVARLDGVGMRRPQVVGRVTGQDSHAFILYLAH